MTIKNHISTPGWKVEWKVLLSSIFQFCEKVENRCEAGEGRFLVFEGDDFLYFVNFFTISKIKNLLQVYWHCCKISFCDCLDKREENESLLCRFY